MKVLSGALVVLALVSPLAAQAPAPGAEGEKVERLIDDLEDEAFAVRDRARKALLEAGMEAVPRLLEASRSDSPETRLSARKIIERIRQDVLLDAFKRFGALPDEKLDVEHGMWLVARILDLEVTEKSIAARLDRMAEAVRKELGKEVVPARAPPVQVVAALNKVLGEQFGLEGDFATYDHPDNSSVHRVLERKRGLPILLSEIAVAVGRRLDVPLVGLAVPGRYMFKYDGARAPKGADGADIIVDPFAGWKTLTAEELARSLPGFDMGAVLAPARPRATMVRMLTNMHSDALDLRRIGLAEQVGELRSHLRSEDERFRPFP